jgi:hypothetical protein
VTQAVDVVVGVEVGVGVGVALPGWGGFSKVGDAGGESPSATSLAGSAKAKHTF